MTHEPECHGCDCEKPYSCTHPWCLCDELRTAYQRGRDDERKAIQYDLILGLARRDGEQE